MGGGFRFIGWDYRGLHDSEAPRGKETCGVRDHARDLLQVIEQCEIERPVLVGWSMGVQVILELHRSHPGIPAAFVALHGTAGRPLETAFDSDRMARVAPRVFALMRAIGASMADRAPRLAQTPGVIEAFTRGARSLGLVSRDIDVEHFRGIVEEWLGMDFAIYAEIFERLSAHDAWSLLPAVRCPTLVIAGDADRFTPLHLSKAMVEQLPDARLEVLRGATHFGLLEHPSSIAGSIVEFLQERGLVD
jgi:pimeloyl-ACP methyl ester carboxylesterase